MLKECRLPQRGCSLTEKWSSVDPTALVMIWVTSTSSNVGSNPVAGSSWKGGLEVCDSNHSFSNISDIRSSHCANVQRYSTTSRVRSPLWQFCKRSLGPVDWIKERRFVCLLYFNTCVEFKNKKQRFNPALMWIRQVFPPFPKRLPWLNSRPLFRLEILTRRWCDWHEEVITSPAKQSDTPSPSAVILHQHSWNTSRAVLMLGWSPLLVHTPRKSRLDVFQAGYYW